MFNRSRENIFSGQNNRTFLEKPAFFGQMPTFVGPMHQQHRNNNFGPQVWQQGPQQQQRGGPNPNRSPRQFNHPNSMGNGGNLNGGRRNFIPRNGGQQQQNGGSGQQRQSGVNNQRNPNAGQQGQNGKFIHKPRFQQQKGPQNGQVMKRKAVPQKPKDTTDSAAKKVKTEDCPAGAFRVAVTHPQHPLEVLTLDELSVTEKLILQRLMERPDDADPVSFYKCEHQEGYLSIVTANEKSRDWLIAEVTKIKPSEEATLIAVLETNLPKSWKIQGTLPGQEESFEQNLKIFARMNAGLDTKNWKCLEKKPADDGQHYQIIIDDSSKKILVKQGLKLFYKFGQVAFRFCSKAANAEETTKTEDEPKKDTAAAPAKPAEAKK